MRQRALTAAMRYVAERGVTTVHDMSMPAAAASDLAAYASARKANALTTRIYSVMPLAEWERLRDVVSRGRNTAAPTAAATNGCASAA